MAELVTDREEDIPGVLNQSLSSLNIIWSCDENWIFKLVPEESECSEQVELQIDVLELILQNTSQISQKVVMWAFHHQHCALK